MKGKLHPYSPYHFKIDVIWLGREDSNLRMQEPKSCVLPLDDAPEAKMLIIDQDTLPLANSRVVLCVRYAVSIILRYHICKIQLPRIIGTSKGVFCR